MEESMLAKQAKEEGIHQLKVGAAAIKNGHVLLVASLDTGCYEIPSTTLLEEESFDQALKRVLIEKAMLSVERIAMFLNYSDFEEGDKKVRQHNFIVQPGEVYDVGMNEYHTFAWVKPEDGTGYPIDKKNMEILDLIQKAQEA